ncbi:MAG: hypothetical protein GXZ15_05415, partial [Campylobacter sp.]|nr:hypothetical protein [Campylobacter sp.]
ENILKAYNQAKEAFIFLGWAGQRDSEILKISFDLHGATYKVPNSYFNCIKAFKENSINFTSKIFDNVWIKEYENLDDLVKDQAWHLKMRGIEPDLIALKEKLGKLNTLVDKTYVKQGVVVCAR